MLYAVAIVFIVIFALEAAVIIIGNVFTIFVFKTQSALHLKRASLLLINLAVADLLVGVGEVIVLANYKIPRTDIYGALLVPYMSAYSFILGMYPFFILANTFLPLARLFFSGATFFLWREFFSLARLFFLWHDFFSPARLFLSGATFFSLARLFFSGATFFPWRDFFFAGATFFSGLTF